MAEFVKKFAKALADTSKVDSRLECSISRRMTENQKKAKIEAKIQVRHPAVTFGVLLFNNNGRKSIAAPGSQGNKSFFPAVHLNDDVKQWLIDKSNEDPNLQEPWYLSGIGEPRTTCVTTEGSNEDIGILEIVVDTNLTDKQRAKGMLCKCNIVTTIGTLMNFTVSESQFGKMLYGMPPADGRSDDSNEENQRFTPHYRLTHEGTKQVLAYLHQFVDFSTETRTEAAVTAAVAEEITDGATEGFEVVGDEIYGG